MSIAAIVLSVISMILGGVNLLFMVLLCVAWKDFKENWERLKEEVKPKEGAVSPSASLARVGPFTPEEAQKHHERNYAALNGCLKAIEAASLTSEEAQTIPAQLEKAVAFESVQQLHSSTAPLSRRLKYPGSLTGGAAIKTNRRATAALPHTGTEKSESGQQTITENTQCGCKPSSRAQSRQLGKD